MLVVHALRYARCDGGQCCQYRRRDHGPARVRADRRARQPAILSNLTDRRTATARCTIPAAELAQPGIPGAEVVRLVAEANAFAVADPYRAATHNKGHHETALMPFVSPPATTGGPSRPGPCLRRPRRPYRALTDWRVDDNGDLSGEITLPLAVGVVGGATKASHGTGGPEDTSVSNRLENWPG